MAQSSPEQDASVAIQTCRARPPPARTRNTANRILHFQSKANDKGEIPFKIVYKVSRQEVKTDATANVTVKPEESKDLLSRFLKPDAMVPTSGKPLELLKDSKTVDRPVRRRQDHVRRRQQPHDVQQGRQRLGRGDAVWACDSKFGNCSDFHSLFIAMARGNKIPSKFEMGFPLPPKHGNGHRAGLSLLGMVLPAARAGCRSTSPRPTVTRDAHVLLRQPDRGPCTVLAWPDITLEPPQKSPPLNFFIYPYVEVNGQTHEKVDRSFSFET